MDTGVCCAGSGPHGCGGGRGGGGNDANYWAPLTRKRHIMPYPAQPQHTNHWAPRTRKRHRQEHRPQRPTESSNPAQHAKGRTGDCLGPREETTTRRNVTQTPVTGQFVDLETCAKVPGAPGTTQLQVGQPDSQDAGSDMLPPQHRTPEAMSMPAEKQRARNWEERKQQNNWAQSRPASPKRTHNNTQGNHEVRALQQPPNAAHTKRAISNPPPPSLYKVPTYSTRVGAAPRAPGGAHHGGGNRAVTSQPRTGQSTSYGDVKSLYRGGRRVGQEGVRDRGTQERHQTGGGATQTHRTREPHQEGQGRAQQTSRRGTARQERQPQQREQGARMEQMVERARGRQRQ